MSVSELPTARQAVAEARSTRAKSGPPWFRLAAVAALLAASGGYGPTSEMFIHTPELGYHGRWTTASTSPKESQRISGMYEVRALRRPAPESAASWTSPANHSWP